jgi:hypothetical protein
LGYSTYCVNPGKSDSVGKKRRSAPQPADVDVVGAALPRVAATGLLCGDGATDVDWHAAVANATMASDTTSAAQ